MCVREREGERGRESQRRDVQNRVPSEEEAEKGNRRQSSTRKRLYAHPGCYFMQDNKVAAYFVPLAGLNACVVVSVLPSHPLPYRPSVNLIGRCCCCSGCRWGICVGLALYNLAEKQLMDVMSSPNATPTATAIATKGEQQQGLFGGRKCTHNWQFSVLGIYCIYICTHIHISTYISIYLCIYVNGSLPSLYARFVSICLSTSRLLWTCQHAQRTYTTAIACLPAPT